MKKRMLALLDRLIWIAKTLQRRWLAPRYAALLARREIARLGGVPGLAIQNLRPIPDLDRARSVLIFKPDEIGDFVCGLPAIAALRARYPKLDLYIVVQRPIAALAERTGLFKGVAAADVRYRFVRFPVWDPTSVTRQLGIAEFDCALYLRLYPNFFRAFRRVRARSIVHALDPRLPSRSPYRYPVPSYGPVRVHMARQLLELIAPLLGREIRADDLFFPAFQFHATERAQVEAHVPEAGYIAVHPFSRTETRRYPIEYWRELWDKLRQNFGLPIVIVGGKEDPVLPDTEGLIQLQGQLDLTATAYLLSRARAFIGGDSGPGHLAAAQGVPTFTLFGGLAHAEEWAPLGTQLTVRADVPCAPCECRVCPGYGLVCLTSLTPERVWPSLQMFLREKAQFE